MEIDKESGLKVGQVVSKDVPKALFTTGLLKREQVCAGNGEEWGCKSKNIAETLKGLSDKFDTA